MKVCTVPVPGLEQTVGPDWAFPQAFAETSAAEFVEIVVEILAAFAGQLDIRCCCKAALDQALLH